MVITVQATNQPPVANAGTDQDVTDTDGDGSESVTLNGAGSTDDGSIASYLWTGTSVPTGTIGATPTISLPVAGSPHTITLEVTDDKGATDTDVVVITVQAAVAGGAYPVVLACTPNSGNTSQKYDVAVTGSDFVDGATVKFGGRIAVQGVTFIGSDRLDVRIKVNKRADSGPREVTVTNPDSNFGSLAGCFTVN